MSSRASSPAELERQGAPIVAAMAAAHACPPGCERCAEERALVGVPANAREWAGFVRSDDAYRACAHARRTGRPFPVMTNDEVLQWMLEEALYERVELSERLEEARAFNTDGAAQNLEGRREIKPVSNAHADALAKARAFADSQLVNG